MSKFAKRLKELRNERGLSQAELAKATGLSHTALVYWENEKRIPKANAVLILAEFFGVTTDYLLGAKDYN